jgi:hypothetical protein
MSEQNGRGVSNFVSKRLKQNAFKEDSGQSSKASRLPKNSERMIIDVDRERFGT